MLTTKSKCKGCGSIHTLNSNIIQSSWATVQDGQSIRVLYYDCPKCGLRNVVQVDNEQTLELLSGLEKLLVKARKTQPTRNKNKDKNKYKGLFDVRRQLLVDTRETLNKKVNGMVVSYDDGVSHILEVGDCYGKEN